LSADIAPESELHTQSAIGNPKSEIRFCLLRISPARHILFITITLLL
jgi:hypothetical protein